MASLSLITSIQAKQVKKIYWLIPDGMRAEPNLFKIYDWARQGKLPNLKKLIEGGTYGHSIPNYPSHTPVNFASLLTGTNPTRHGVADGPMHLQGHPLKKISLGGFSSSARKIPAAWTLFENVGKKVAVISVPGSTPPEIDNGIVVRGRWGGWGADIYSIVFESQQDGKRQFNLGRGRKLFFLGPELTKFISPKPVKKAYGNFSPSYQLDLDAWGNKILAFPMDTQNDKKNKYDKVIFTDLDKKEIAKVEIGKWSPWIPASIKFKNQTLSSHYKLHPIKVGPDGFVRIRVLFDVLNRYSTYPASAAKKLKDLTGPMVDFVDNFPPQLIHYKEDRGTFLDEMNLSFDWHTKVIGAMHTVYKPDVVIHNIYSPNQMLTSRWWLGHVDPASLLFKRGKNKNKTESWSDILNMYKRLDTMIGEILKYADKDSLIVLSSDHGATPLNKWVRLNNLFAKHGYLKYKINKKTGDPVIDWKNSKAVYLKMDSVYIHPDGLGGNWKRGSGKKYLELRKKIRALLVNLKDKDGISPLEKIATWEEAPKEYQLPKERVGDLVIANKAGFGWNEEISTDQKIFDTPLKSGYKQAILPKNTPAMWTPFVIFGPGIKKNQYLKKPIHHADQLPTILKAMQIKAPKNIQGKVIKHAFE